MSEPKPYLRRPARFTWYLEQRHYLQHMAQELTSVFVGASALLLLLGIRALAGGEQAWRAFLVSLDSPLALGLQWLLLIATLYHSVSWFAVTPKAMPMQIGERFAPGFLISGAHYIAWLIVSLVILYVAGVF